ncbi:GGDEF domain-containing protein [Clostridium sp. IBUN22A]|uniref:GGDEF domain-containing protein n=1 Tax=unclassified Clostridium TaxID=2614128 RepID=UPI00061F4FDE|nr:hypothetical protein ClosIBUN13A_CONTIG66g00730 [Clostridium sp. IBUN13A]KJZ87394.1 diguanylate cyclase/phosphodiesterase (GGDEF & EAL domain) with PAS/PAC sensor(s) [Clostridium sp. IBUN125C]KJZ88075.1 diguanylate cyclase/phosphodiesterase (GGDEF & EAL domain) with PAS/PAC sensor(s) [Clostridium sp. IBUN22A]KJZ93787.1 hypothetical protein ClosIBUN62F_CONTIG34g01261 [Clostridium sp. IBUN62F]
MNYKSKISIHFAIIIYFNIYFISTVYESSFWGDILSPVGTIIAFIMLFYVYKKSTGMHLIWLFLSLSALFWTMSDIAWAICELILVVNPPNIKIFNFLYLIPNVFILISVLMFFVKISKKFNRIQFLLDIVAISYSSIIIFWNLLMHNSFIAFIRSLDNLILFLYMVSDCIIISSVALLVLSIRKGRIPGGIYLTFFAGGFYSIIDLLCSYDYFYDLYVPNSIIDSGYILSFLLIAYGALLVLKEKNESQVKKFYCEFENSGTSKKSFLLLTFPIIFIIFKGFQYTELILLILTYMFYKILSIYVQNVIKNEKLLIKEKNMNLILEEKINERTKELILKNKELEYISNHDSITKVYNGRYFKNTLADMINSENSSNKITVLYIDFDRFKSINDTYGHDVGDEVLIEISKRLAITNNKDNILARLGG